ncbi:MAG: hypothetical protein Q7J16_02230 [Candidatus Cloacimonadales bacterium]|nr:hypothetical protein [Candidatus Cloacimonadales bacterium]
MKYKISIILILLTSTLSFEAKTLSFLNRKAIQISLLSDFETKIDESIFISYKRHLRNNNAYNVCLNAFYNFSGDKDKLEDTELNKFKNGFSLGFELQHYLMSLNDYFFYYGVGLMGKYYYQEHKEIKKYTYGDLITTDFQKRWNPIFYPFLGCEYFFCSSFSINMEYSITMSYSNEVLKSKMKFNGMYEDVFVILSNREIEEYNFNPVNIRIGISYYF